MQKIQIMLFGEVKNVHYRELFNYYLKLCGKYFQIELIIKKDPGERKINKLDVGEVDANTWLLDENGKDYSSLHFAKLLGAGRESGAIKVIMANAYGFSEELKLGNRLLSLSKLTFPHELAAVVLMEQMFRAGNILANGKYHK